MVIEDLLIAYKAQVNVDVAQQVDANTIDPDTVANIGIDLANILQDELPKQNRFVIGSGTASPSGGADTDLYFKALSNAIEVYRNIEGTWTLLATIPLDIALPDGILVGLRTSITGSLVTVYPGAWAINNAKYEKYTQTQFTLAASHASFDRWDLIYADANDDILIITGTPTLVPVEPTLPADCVIVDYAYIPAVGVPYLLGGQNNTSTAYNNTTVQLTAPELNTQYPGVGLDFKVICTNITDSPMVYMKGPTDWYSFPLATV